MNTRTIILHILENFDKKPRPIDAVIDQQLVRTPVDHRDRRFVFEIVYGIVKRRATIDYVISRHLDEPSLLENEHIKRLLEIGVYQLLFMDRVPDHAAVNETVNAAHADFRSKGRSAVINAVLRACIADKKRLLLPDQAKDLLLRLSVEFSHPRWIIERWLAQFGLAKTKKLLAFNNRKPDVFFRRKYRGITRQQFEAETRDYLAPAGGYHNLYYKLTRQLIAESVGLFQEGLCTIQAPSSGWVAALLDVKKGDAVLDMCSAPGGKTALVAELTGSDGCVIACEVSRKRRALVADTVGRLRLNNVRMLLADGAALPFASPFSKVLLDAPCSGTGVLHRHPEARWLKTADDIARMAHLQKKLLAAAAAVTAPGGVLVYSTCSLEPEENEARIAEFLAEHPHFSLDAPPPDIPAVLIDKKGFLRITPFDHDLDGMFGARLKRNA